MRPGTANSGAGDQPYFAMEFIDGWPLLQYANTHGLDTRARLELMAKSRAPDNPMTISRTTLQQFPPTADDARCKPLLTKKISYCQTNSTSASVRTDIQLNLTTRVSMQLARQIFLSHFDGA